MDTTHQNAPLRWGIIGAGHISAAFADQLPQAGRPHRLVHVASRSADRAGEFAAEHPGGGSPRSSAGYDEILADPEVDAVYIGTIHTTHAEIAIAAAAAGKHLLVEKPFTVTRSEAVEVLDAVREAGVFCLEAFKARCHPQAERLVEIIRSGELGTITRIEADFSFCPRPRRPEHRLWDPRQAGGAILDLGCYAIDGMRAAGHAATAPDGATHNPAEPELVAAQGWIGPTGVDEHAQALFRFERGGHDVNFGPLLASISCSLVTLSRSRMRVMGTEGHLELDHPWGPGNRALPAVMHRRLRDHWRLGDDAERIELPDPRPAMAIEADAVADGIAAGRTQAVPPGMTWNDTLSTMDLLDRWRAAVGVTG